MRVLFDTGSSYSWFLTKESAEPLNFDQYYNRLMSSTYVDPEINLKVSIQFGIGALKGFFV